MNMSSATLRALPWEIALEYFTRTLYPIGEIANAQAAFLPRLSHALVYELTYEVLDQAIDCLKSLANDQTSTNAL